MPACYETPGQVAALIRTLCAVDVYQSLGPGPEPANAPRRRKSLSAPSLQTAPYGIAFASTAYHALPTQESEPRHRIQPSLPPRSASSEEAVGALQSPYYRGWAKGLIN